MTTEDRELESLIATSNSFEKQALDLAAENKALLGLVSEISQMCIGEIAMGYKLDSQYIGNRIYEVTGLTSPELIKKVGANG